MWSVGVLDVHNRPEAPSELEKRFFEFLSEFRIDNEFVHRRVFEPRPTRGRQLTSNRDRLRSSLLMHHHTLDVDLRDLAMFNEELAQNVQARPADMIPWVREFLPWSSAALTIFSLRRRCSGCRGSSCDLRARTARQAQPRSRRCRKCRSLSGAA